MAEDNRLLTDDDVKAIADALEQRIVERFYSDLGRGVWAVIWKAAIAVAIALAAAGSIKGLK